MPGINSKINPLFWRIINEDNPAAQLALKPGADPNYPAGALQSAMHFI